MINLKNSIDKFFDSLADGLGTNTVIFLFILIAIAPLWYQLPQTPME